MTLMKSLMGAAAALALMAGMAAAEPALIFDLGGKFDKSFNEAAFNGAQRWATETGGTYKELEMQSEAQREQFVRRMAESGANPIVVMGFQNMATLEAGGPRLSRHQVRADRRRGRPAQRALGDVHRT
jgi:basic membrane protein A and related proteins